MISESLALTMVIYALAIGAGIGVALAFLIDYLVGWVSFHRIFRMIQRCQYAWAIRHHRVRYPAHNYRRPFLGGDLIFQDDDNE